MMRATRSRKQRRLSAEGSRDLRRVWLGRAGWRFYLLHAVRRELPQVVPARELRALGRCTMWYLGLPGVHALRDLWLARAGGEYGGLWHLRSRVPCRLPIATIDGRFLEKSWDFWMRNHGFESEIMTFYWKMWIYNKNIGNPGRDMGATTLWFFLLKMTIILLKTTIFLLKMTIFLLKMTIFLLINDDFILKQCRCFLTKRCARCVRSVIPVDLNQVAICI